PATVTARSSSAPGLGGCARAAGSTACSRGLTSPAASAGGRMRVVNVPEAGGWTRFVGLGGVYLGRTRHLGNRFTGGSDGDRWAVVERYRRWLWRQLVGFNRTVQMALSRLRPDGVIGCAAWRHPCHCGVVAEAHRWWAREGHRLYGGIRPDLQ